MEETLQKDGLGEKGGGYTELPGESHGDFPRFQMGVSQRAPNTPTFGVQRKEYFP